jgi:dolichyl-phosphate beta-glucosyltransferase
VPTTDTERGHFGEETEVSVIVPAYNEAARLPDTLEAILELGSVNTEVIFVDDGSTDSTLSILEAATEDNPYAHVVAAATNRGKGAAVRLGMAQARGRSLVFMDADLATDLAGLDPLIAALEDHHVAIGSRSISGTVVRDASAKRKRMGASFNRLVRSATDIPFEDTQCGFKAFRAPIGKLLFALGRIDGFAFDVEMLTLARQLDLRVTEIPIQWHQVEGSHVRPIADALRMSRDVIRARRPKLDAPARVCSARFPCAPGAEFELRSEILSHVRSFDLAMALDGSVLLLAPFVRPQHMDELVRRVASVADPSTVEITGLDAGAVLEVVATSRGGQFAEAVHHHSTVTPCDRSLSPVPALDLSLI